MNHKPCIVQRDRTVLLETAHADFEAARRELSKYADLIKSPSSFHTYRITPLSLWNAAAGGMSADSICASLEALARWGVPGQVGEEIRRLVGRYGRLSLLPHPSRHGLLQLRCNGEPLLDELRGQRTLAEVGLVIRSSSEGEVPADRRGLLKQELTRLGYPVLDHAGYQDGQPLDIRWREEPADAKDEVRPGAAPGKESPEAGEGTPGIRLRDYQRDAAASIRDEGGAGGSGIIVLPCGAGKTVIGLAAMRELQCETLILTSNATSVRQWVDEIMRWTTLPPEHVGEYTGQRKEVRPVTVATYQILTFRGRKEEELSHMKLFNERRWGLIIYDEVHLLPAPVFRATADIQATRRLGLTATLVREDGREDDVFSLIGPKRYELPWKPLEEQGWIAAVECLEVKVPMPRELREKCQGAGKREQYRLAAENPSKLPAVMRIVERHAGARILVIGQYLDQLEAIAGRLQAPLITGRTAQQERNALYAAFRRGDVRLLIVSKVANFAVDLPDASVAIEVSGSYGSRQEEAQRLGRLLRPKPGENRAFFYTLVTEDSREEHFALKRRLFLIEQGYEYRATAATDDALASGPVQHGERSAAAGTSVSKEASNP